MRCVRRPGGRLIYATICPNSTTKRICWIKAFPHVRGLHRVPWEDGFKIMKARGYTIVNVSVEEI